MMNKKSLCTQLICLVIVLFFASITCTQDTQPQKQLLKQGNDSYYVKGALVVGFKKGVSPARAENILKNYRLKYERTNDVNMGKKFHYETGEKFLVVVPDGEEQIWLEKFKKIPEVKATGRYLDPDKVLVD